MDPDQMMDALMAEDGEVPRKSKNERQAINDLEAEVEQRKRTEGMREDLRKLACMGASKHYIGKELTLSDVERLPQKKVESYHSYYQGTLGRESSQAIFEALGTLFANVVSWIHPVNKEGLIRDWGNNQQMRHTFSKHIGGLALRGGDEVVAFGAGLCDVYRNLQTTTNVPVTEASTQPSQEPAEVSDLRD